MSDMWTSGSYGPFWMCGLVHDNFEIHRLFVCKRNISSRYKSDIWYEKMSLLNLGYFWRKSLKFVHNPQVMSKTIWRMNRSITVGNNEFHSNVLCCNGNIAGDKISTAKAWSSIKSLWDHAIRTLGFPNFHTLRWVLLAENRDRATKMRNMRSSLWLTVA